MSWEGIDHMLDRVRGEADRIALQCGDLDRDGRHRTVRSAKLVGRTRRRWEEAEVRVHSLWTVYAALRAVVDRARDLRASADPNTPSALTRLLDGPSVALPDGDGPGARITLAEAVARATADHEEITEVISAVETAWDALRPRLAELESMWSDIGTHSDMVGLPEEAHEDLRAELAGVDETIHRDPLSLVVDGHVVTTQIERLRVLLDRTRGELRDALRMRDSYHENVERLRFAIDDVGRIVERARILRARVVAKVSSPAAVDVHDPVPALSAAVADLDVLRAEGRWRDLGARLGVLQRAIHDATDDAREREASLTRLLERRAELRGRLGSYRARAARLGLTGDRRLTELHGAAHWELWRVPCDLRAATVSLSAYLRALQETSGADFPEDGTTSGAWAPDGGSDGGVTR
ncbi:hypothetical protein BJF83_12285 [Nocardiopsis sp. CNR-923]|uniref:hypothetical protein n=1 Tax=Nocardiopsis sp. CNR-923 TaxID=1904965 RepID=UPI000960FCD3|nr:hypothetical protein [Nocardiopsis sp. CNR-923]OLT29348.1 hypothetical protein BJF83_12285 [Nocardiopsis sp. CNR-923]